MLIMKVTKYLQISSCLNKPTLNKNDKFYLRSSFCSFNFNVNYKLEYLSINFFYEYFVQKFINHSMLNETICIVTFH